MADTILTADANINMVASDFWGTLSGSKGWFEFKGWGDPYNSGCIVPRHRGYCNICFCDGHAQGMVAPHNANGSRGGWTDYMTPNELGNFGDCPWYERIPTYPYAFARMSP
jgi:prepilin-type processing-associated H-X9-DG protein